MSEEPFVLKLFILKSDNKEYIENKVNKILVKKKIGEGSYGIIFLLDNDHVIKIFKKSTLENSILTESNYLLPIQNENRELIFYYKYINKKKENNFIINLFAIGLIRDIIVDKTNTLDINSYFIIMPQCVSFYNNFNIYNAQLINKKNGLNFTLNVMKRLLEISQFLENKFNIVNIDFKLNNFMFSEKSKNLNNLIMIDFSIIKKKSKKKIEMDKKYYIWPNNKFIYSEIIPPYSSCINGLELLFGHKEVLDLPNEKKINYFLEVIKNKNDNAYKIFFNGLVLKINTENFLKMF